MRHGVQRAIEALRDALRLLLLEDRGEQDVSNGVGELADGEEERRRQKAEHDVIGIPAQDEAERNRPGQPDDQDDDHARRAVVAPGDRSGCRQRGADRRDFGKIVVADVNRDEAERAERHGMHRAVEDVGVFAGARFLPGHGRRKPVVPAEAPYAQDADDDEGGGYEKIGEVAGLPVDENDQQSLRSNADSKCRTVAEQGLYKRNVDVDRNFFFSLCSHVWFPRWEPSSATFALRKA